MEKLPKKSVLGKGLDALIPKKIIHHAHTSHEDSANQKNQIHELDISKIKPNKGQPRIIFDNEKLEELCRSIKEHGVISPILVQPDGDGYRIVFGERRYRAVKQMNGKTIPAIITNTSEEKSHLIALIENIQRVDLNAIEEAEAYKKLMNDFDFTQEQLSEKVGKSRSAIANIIRLLNLPKEIQQFLIEKKLSMGHIRTLLAIESIEKQLTLAHKAVVENLSVRDLELIVYAKNTETENSKNKTKNKAEVENKNNQNTDPHINRVVEKLQHFFSCKVDFIGSANKGKIQFEYHSQDELNRILELLNICD